MSKPLLMTTPPVVQYLSVAPGRRIIAVSDIHGNLPYLKGLLRKCAFSGSDILVIVGDLLEKGPDPLGTLRWVMALSREYEVYTVCGNCDFWQNFCDLPDDPDMDAFYIRYLVGRNKGWGDGVIAQMLRELGIAIGPDMNLKAAKRAVATGFPAELDFLRHMPHILETEDYIFVHGGYVPERGAFACMKLDAYRTVARPHRKWTIVGHWPLVLYHEDITDARPIIDRDLRLISIDGGCVVKDDGQLNAFLLPDMTWLSYDAFPVARAAESQRESENHFYIRHGDNAVRLLAWGKEFCRCRHIRTGYEMDVLTCNILSREGDRAWVNDCTDYRLPLEAGDEISIVRTTTRGYQIKRGGISGWYDGPIMQ
ncbi:MAG: metallophosphoesterase [Oscillospiraceae bacterium]|nr:metallophosphoesterase [Oscillospiraceae bacterium]